MRELEKYKRWLRMCQAMNGNGFSIIGPFADAPGWLLTTANGQVTFDSPEAALAAAEGEE